MVVCVVFNRLVCIRCSHFWGRNYDSVTILLHVNAKQMHKYDEYVKIYFDLHVIQVL